MAINQHYSYIFHDIYNDNNYSVKQAKTLHHLSSLCNLKCVKQEQLPNIKWRIFCRIKMAVLYFYVTLSMFHSSRHVCEMYNFKTFSFFT